jgi:hypothetical protein
MSSYIVPTMNHALKVAITAAIKSLEFKKYEVQPDNVVDCFITDLFGVLFPEDPAPVTVEPKVHIIPISQPQPVAVKAKKPRAPRKPKESKDENISRLNPKQTEILKKTLGRKAEAKDKKALLVYLNDLDPEEFGDDASKTFEEHVVDFMGPKSAVVESVEVPIAESDVEMDTAEMELIAVTYGGEEFWVDPVTKKVYETQGSVDVVVGDLGLAKFADMRIPDDA